MKQLQIDEQKARVLYKTASPEFKTMLEDSFGREFFSEKIQDSIVKEVLLDAPDLSDRELIDAWKGGRNPIIEVPNTQRYELALAVISRHSFSGATSAESIADYVVEVADAILTKLKQD